MNRATTKALEQMRVGEKVEVWEAAKQLVKKEDLGAVPQLLDILANAQDVERRVAAASTLGSLRSSVALKPLIQILDDGSLPPVLRDQAAESLGHLSDPNARPVLLKNLFDQDANVMFSCAFALRTVGLPDDIPQLQKLTRNASLTNSYGASVAQEAREAIEQIRSRTDAD